MSSVSRCNGDSRWWRLIQGSCHIRSQCLAAPHAVWILSYMPSKLGMIKWAILRHISIKVVAEVIRRIKWWNQSLISYAVRCWELHPSSCSMWQLNPWILTLNKKTKPVEIAPALDEREISAKNTRRDLKCLHWFPHTKVTMSWYIIIYIIIYQYISLYITSTSSLHLFCV